jgi:hypothetical protein
MHPFARTDDRIDRARRQTLRAADANTLIDLRNQGGALDPVRGVQGERLPM